MPRSDKVETGGTAKIASVRTRASRVVVVEIERALASGELKVNDRLPSERELSKRLGVSRATVREAIQELVGDGLLGAHPNDPTGGWRIQEPSEAPFRRALLSTSRFHNAVDDLVQFRVFLESTAASLAAAHRTEEHLAEMRKRQDALRELIDGDPVAFGEADAAFHHAVAEASGNRLIAMCSSGCRSAVKHLIGDLLTKSEDRGTVMRDYVSRHQKILDAIAEGDSRRAGDRAAGDILECYPLGQGRKHPPLPLFTADLLS
ncbi:MULTISPECIES: FadR/GntR family transcriptional regulator [Streptomyces]|uniref:FadR/GntR family transcriptional regulator n=1 Tax=Streptomyces TaxID=1883 RepID=UPI00167331D3|nr:MULTISPECIES: FCD domain-containing protein [Streptomyces]MBK3526063.1 FadR family transcriptional regulator [Streptomyces sp. MBT70]GGR75808.1 GntR family transcriptional regulator [Streptomyces eurythermus]